MDLSSAHNSHPRNFASNRYVYPVISRRSQGLSLGINLNPNKACNFDCPYCQVDRRPPSLLVPEKSILTNSPEKSNLYTLNNFPPVQNDDNIDLNILEDELIQALLGFDFKGVCQFEQFKDVPAENKILQDIALSGDGEPTAVKEFEEVCKLLLKLQHQSPLTFRLVLISNSTLFSKPSVVRGIEHLLALKGSIWAKLDAGNEDWYQLVNKSKIPYTSIVQNIKFLGQKFPLSLQTLWHSFIHTPLTHSELTSYIQRVEDLQNSGTQISDIQFHTLARLPADSSCLPLELATLIEWAREASQLTGLPVKAYI